MIEEDFDGNEARSEVEATTSDEHDKQTAEKDSQPGSNENGDRIFESGSSLPELLPKKGTTSEVWRHFGLRHEGRMITVFKHCGWQLYQFAFSSQKQAPGCVCYNQNEVITVQKEILQ